MLVFVAAGICVARFIIQTLGGCAPRDHRVDSARPPRSRIPGRKPSPPTGVVPYPTRTGAETFTQVRRWRTIAVRLIRAVRSRASERIVSMLVEGVSHHVRVVGGGACVCTC